ncbi:MAG: sulfite exporter TauE/SafE family protein [Gemmatimonadaceae bacterium]|nr:sulfite exporter TauE/SafE family protein [Gemmatimonadaceae bacterium]
MDFSRLADQLSTSPGAALPLLFLGGVLTSLNPCIYPMIPITAAIVGGSTAGAPVARGRVFVLSLAYAVGLALVYSVLGLVAGLSGTIFGAVSSNPWIYFTMAQVLLVAGLAMLGVIPVRVPGWLAARAATAGKGGRLAGAFAMGAMSGLVAAPCGAPVFAAVLTWVTTTRSAVLGFAYLFSFSLGMCTLLILVGLSGGLTASLPRAGAWMLWVKRFFAALMFVAAEYYLIQAGKLWL